MGELKIVIDTNVLIKTVKRTNPEFAIYKAFSLERSDWVISTGILNEYEEKLTEFYSEKTAHLIVEVLCTAPNVIFAEPHFRWNLIEEDPDDNKFSDLAIQSMPIASLLLTGISIYFITLISRNLKSSVRMKWKSC